MSRVDLAQEAPPVITFTMREAAQVCGVSPSTIKRRHAAKGFPNAYQDSNGTWRIPTTDLLAAGLRPRAETQATTTTDQGHEPGSESSSTSADPATTEELRLARTELARLREQLTHERENRRIAEARAEVYEQVQADLRTALRALSAPSQPLPAPEPQQQPTPAPAESQSALQRPPQPAPEVRRRWWQLRR